MKISGLHMWLEGRVTSAEKKSCFRAEASIYIEILVPRPRSFFWILWNYGV